MKKYFPAALMTNPLVGDAALASSILDELLSINRLYPPQFNQE